MRKTLPYHKRNRTKYPTQHDCWRPHRKAEAEAEEEAEADLDKDHHLGLSHPEDRQVHPEDRLAALEAHLRDRQVHR